MGEPLLTVGALVWFLSWKKKHKEQPVRTLLLMVRGCWPSRGSWATAPLTTVDAQMLLQVVFVLESFSTLATFELAVPALVQQRLQRETPELRLTNRR